jgi:hypothetical protein
MENNNIGIRYNLFHVHLEIKHLEDASQDIDRYHLFLRDDPENYYKSELAHSNYVAEVLQIDNQKIN